MNDISREQLDIIEQQLGRPPRGLVAIARQTDDGVPLVLQMRSLVDDQPFPTLYWLCSRDLHRAIAQIEDQGWVKEIEAEIEQDEALHAAYQADQRAYVERRWQLMAEEDRSRIAQLGFSELFDRYGIGGIANWDKVRCLHMQYAQHLVMGSEIGRRMDRLFELPQLQIRL
ncbi:DUF501 domain-containing protein [Marinobacterium arenosum]|uniref:DUF501 domain-containing protein n=1 Tax=Marinobacterium arenosum TaxID=2862496 RepID=UPI001C939854|nr:DUF501 domain-containing protein [Marinobacterium arenosum]MBY4678639.1 DUF501 domain-containing protein [Marinobacterium arenosum]